MEFRLLGPVEVEADGRALQLGGRRQRCVLTHLLLHRATPVPSDWLIDQVWGDRAPGAVRASLHTYVSRLRSELGADRLLTRSQGYVLQAADEEVDVARAERLISAARAAVDDDDAVGATGAYDAALALPRGPALGDLADEPSLRAAAARLDGLVAAARRERVGVRLRLGQHVALVPELEELLRQDPLQEDLWEHYLLALYRSGRQADALAGYGRLRASLRDELGIEPSPALARLHERLLRQDPGLALTRSALRGYRTLGVLGQGASAVVHRAVQPHTGREVALKSLHGWLADDPELVQRFAAEAQAAVQLEHPHVVPVHDYWREPGGAFLVLRLLRGGSLAQRLEAGPLPAGAVLRLVEQVCRALEALPAWAAAAPLDLDDVLLDEHDNAYLSGFRLARTGASVAAGGAAREPVTATATVGRLLTALLERSPSPPPARDVAEAAVGGAYPDVDALCAELRSCLLPAVPAPRTPDRAVAARNPYKGLRAFGEADAGDFFGRGRIVERLVARLTTPTSSGPLRFLAVVGPSGCGKSSLVRAGLVPALRARSRDGQPPWYVAQLTPGADPFGELVRALSDVAVVPPQDGTADRLRVGTARLVEEVRALLPGDGELLLVVDQFEELFTLTSADDRRAVIAQLVDAATAEDSRVRVVVTLRGDFYDRPLRDSELAELLRVGTEVVVPLSPEELQQAVVEPGARVGLRVEPALLAQVVADAGDTSTSLPLLQYALTELADGRTSGDLTLAGYRQLGGVAGALVRRADATYLALDPEQQAVARQVLLELVHPDDSGADTRRRVRQPELEQCTGRPAVARAVLTALGAARLVGFDRDPATRVPTVTVAHEALLREWALLRGWLDSAREDLRTERRLAATAQEWDDTGRDPSFLAAGSRLAALERWAARWSSTGGWTPAPLERAYLDAALAARDRAREEQAERLARERALEQRSVRRLRVAAALLAVAVVGVSSLTVYGFSQRNRAERESVVAQARGLAAASAASLDEDPERSVLLALEAVRLAREEDTEVLPETEAALHAAVGASRVRLTVPGIGGAVDWSAQGLLVTEGTGDSGRVELRDGRTGEVALSVPGHGAGAGGHAFSPDGGRLLTTGGDGAARLWDPVTRRLLWEHQGSGQAWGPTFSGDGSRVAASWPDEDVVRVFDVADGRLAGEVALPAGSTALTHDGAWIVVPDHRGPGGARVLEVSTGRLVRLVAPDRPAPDAIDISPDGRWLVTAGVDFTARVWSVADGSSHGTLGATSTISDVDWSPDSSRVALGAVDGVVRLFEVDDEGVREDLRLSSSVLRGVLGVAFSPDGREVLLGDMDVRAAQVVDVSVGGSREWLTAPVPRDVVGADFTDGGAKVVASADGGGLVLRDVASGRAVLRIGVGRGVVGEVATSPDRSLVAGSVPGELVVWDVRSGEEVFHVFARSRPRGLTWSRDSTLLGFVTEDGLPHLVDRTGRPTAAPPGAGRVDEVIALALTPDGGRVVTSHRPRGRGGAGRVLVHDRVSRRLLAEWPATGNRLAVSPDGRLVAVAVAGGDVDLHDLLTGSRVLPLVGHATTVRDLQFSADGRRLATAGQDGTVRLWSTSSGKEELVLRGHRSAVLSARLSTDGTRLVSASGDGTVRVWALDLDDLVELAEQRTTRALTADECRRYLQRSCG